MDNLATTFGAVALGLGGLFFFIILRTLTGALAGWTVGLVFGGFVKTKTTVNNK